MINRTILWSSILSFIAALLQSTLLSKLAILDVIPDIALGIVVFTAYVNGTRVGQFSGFFSGFIIDFLSAAPLGLNAFVRTVIGALTGLLKGTFFLDIIVLPVVLCASATLIKALIVFLLHLLFASAIPYYSLSSSLLWIELAMNSLLAPFLFGFLKLFKTVLVPRKDS